MNIKKWTDPDLCEFAEWTSIWGWKYDYEMKIWLCSLYSTGYTTEDILEAWKIEKRKEEQK